MNDKYFNLYGEPAFYDDIREYWRDWKMENQKGRKPKYLTVDRFEKFLSNDFMHLKWEVRFVMAVVLATFGAAIARLFMG